jgi:hypothetical protein
LAALGSIMQSDGHSRCCCRNSDSGRALLGGFEVDDRAQHFAPITEKDA